MSGSWLFLKKRKRPLAASIELWADMPSGSGTEERTLYAGFPIGVSLKLHQMGTLKQKTQPHRGSRKYKNKNKTRPLLVSAWENSN